MRLALLVLLVVVLVVDEAEMAEEMPEGLTAAEKVRGDVAHDGDDGTALPACLPACFVRLLVRKRR